MPNGGVQVARNRRHTSKNMKDNLTNNVAVSRSPAMTCSTADNEKTRSAATCKTGNLKFTVFVETEQTPEIETLPFLQGDDWEIVEWADDLFGFYAVVEFDDGDNFTHEKLSNIKREILDCVINA